MSGLMEDLGESVLKPFSAFLRTAAAGDNITGDVIRESVSEAEGTLHFTLRAFSAGQSVQSGAIPGKIP